LYSFNISLNAFYETRIWVWRLYPQLLAYGVGEAFEKV